MKTSKPQIDELGFRNPSLPKQAEIIALGDSFTYGYNVSSNNSWPYLLKKETKYNVYNMGIGSYNILSYYASFQIALQHFKPETIIVAIFPGNDFRKRGYCKLITLNFWKKFESAHDLRSPNCEPESIRRSVPVHFSEWFYYAISKTALGDALLYFSQDRYITWKENKKERKTMKIKINSTAFTLKPWRTKRHSRFTNLNDNNVLTMFENSEKIIKLMSTIARSNNVNLGMLIIPSKARVLYRALRKTNGSVPAKLRNLTRNETEFIQNLEKFFERNQISYNDATEELVHTVIRSSSEKSNMQIYPKQGGHPLKPGYKAIARTAKSLLE